MTALVRLAVKPLRELARLAMGVVSTVRHAIFGPDRLQLYVSRVNNVRDLILGSDAPRFRALMDEVDRLGWLEHPQAVESLFSEAYELFCNAHRRYVESPPGHYEQSIAWKYELTSYGLGRPTIDEALAEAFIDAFLDGYSSFLADLAERKVELAAYAADRIREVEGYFERL